MADFARPELMATPSGSPSNLGRARRPDRRRPLAARRHRARAVRRRPRAGRRPPRLAAAVGRGHGERRHAVPRLGRTGWPRRWAAPGSATGRRPCCTTTRSRTTRHARGGASAPTASTRRGSSRAAGPAWVDGNWPVVGGTQRAAAGGRSRRGSRPGGTSRRRTSAACWARPDVLLVDARGPAEFHGYEGNVRRLGHIPGAVNVPVAAMHLPGTQRLRDPPDAAVDPAQGEHHPRRGGSSATTSRAWRRRSSPGSCRSSATRTSPCTTAAGPSGAAGWTSRSTSRRGAGVVGRRLRVAGRAGSGAPRSGSTAAIGAGPRGRPTGRPPGAGPGSGSAAG